MAYLCITGVLTLRPRRDDKTQFVLDGKRVTANPLDDIKVMYGTRATRQSEDGHSVQLKAVKYTIRDGVLIDSQALLRDVREMVATAKANQVKGIKK
jgi:hypothetical protein